ncbi:MAG: hypothetical protein SAL07_09495 [Oscillatoria sp. PMC 1051.18]|uniref:hypothetical protein n=1 Tax=Oscillatoria salina TaxID=331517 RepID=UPI0013B61B5B|nr:hypothetical protein [Oscillatoria salina]MBZ8181729.1 hypothetical protein [Oscillatoria salina IIICB1]MEC4892393.1 hypothetical protein [Oscillatoria sp. PMC 1050.18]MEC5030136.1 hypothetical protein [Oscillatoria sp. PMC 1051.18]NET89906.1 hypothetical protein [Kamptonema sp. SIO1D9]
MNNKFLVPPRLLPGAVSDLFAQVSKSGCITLADRYGLMAAILEEDSLSEEEKASLDRLLRATIRGRMRLVDELSAVLIIN